MMKLKRFGKISALVLIASIAILGIWMGIQQLTGNFHEVLPGEFYRSAQPKSGKIQTWRASFGLRSIVNLRDDISPEDLANEKREAAEAGVVFYHFPMSSSKLLSIGKTNELVQVMKHLPKPLLVHCDHGANRTGLASAVYLGAIAGKGEMEAELQMTPYFGHIPVRGIGRYAMYKTWDIYEETLGF